MGNRTDPVFIGRILWRKRWLVLAGFLVGLATAIVFNLLTSEDASGAAYNANSIIQIDGGTLTLPESPAVESLALQQVQFSDLAVHAQLIQSRSVLNSAVASLNGSPEGVVSAETVAEVDAILEGMSVTPIVGTNRIQMTVGGATPEQASARARAIAEAYAEFLRGQHLQAVEDALLAVDEQLGQGPDSSIVSPATATLVNTVLQEAGAASRSVSSAITQLGTVLPNSESDPETAIFGAARTHLDAADVNVSAVISQLQSLQRQSSLGGTDPLTLQEGMDALGQIATELRSTAITIEQAKSSITDNEVNSELTAQLQPVRDAITRLRLSGTQMSGVSNDPSLSSSDQLLVKQLVAQVNGLADSFSSTLATIESGLNAQTAGPVEATRLIDQIDSASPILQSVVENLSAVRLRTSSSSVFTQLVEAGSRLQLTRNNLASVRSAVSTSLTAGLFIQIDAAAASLRGAAGAIELSLGEIELTQQLSETSATALNQAAANARSSASTISAVARSQSASTSRQALQAASQATLSLAGDIENARDEIALSVSSGGAEILDTVNSSLTLLHEIETRLGQAAALMPPQTEPGEQRPITQTASIASAIVSAQRRTVVSLAQLFEASTGVSNTTMATVLQSASQKLAAAASALSGSVTSLNAISSGEALSPQDRLNLALNRASIATSELELSAGLMGSVQQGVDSVAAARSVDEARVRLNVANTNIGLAIDNLANVSNSPEIDNVVPSLVAQNLTRTRDRLALAIEQLPEIGGIEVEGQEELLAFRVDLELLSVQLPVVNVTVINSNIAAGPAADSSSVEVLDVALLAGAVVGLFIGATGAVLIEFADRKLRTLEDLKVVPGLVPIGVVPQDRPKGNPHPPEVTDNSNSVFAEAVHLTATTLQGELGESHTFLISSPGQREGKTMLAINLARALTLRSQRVLLIDANLRKPDASKILGLAEYDGLANALAFEMDPESFVVEVEGLKVLPAGHASVPAVELLSRSGMDSLLQRARAEYDVVILDAPPVGGFSETSTLMRKCRSVVLVLRSGSTEAAELVETVEAVEAVGATVTGAVLNFVAPRELSHLAHDSYVAPPRRGIRKFITSLPLMGTFGSGSDRRKN